MCYFFKRLNKFVEWCGLFCSRFANLIYEPCGFSLIWFCFTYKKKYADSKSCHSFNSHELKKVQSNSCSIAMRLFVILCAINIIENKEKWKRAFHLLRYLLLMVLTCFHFDGKVIILSLMLFASSHSPGCSNRLES